MVSDPITIIIEQVSVENYYLQPIDCYLSNYPNPFNPSTTISFSVNTENIEDTELVIYNMKGQKVKQLINDQLSAGQHSTIWNGKDDTNKEVSSGIYFYKIKAGNFVDVKKAVLLK
ncbi:MAG: T9SS type A sorting domain-containing protein [Candidatus Cloacimonetes bacterium]|nr:T9SS type A sorting domain-containing protein [Candidatus Cloacimonadota bacterium]